MEPLIEPKEVTVGFIVALACFGLWSALRPLVCRRTDVILVLEAV